MRRRHVPAIPVLVLRTSVMLVTCDVVKTRTMKAKTPGFKTKTPHEFYNQDRDQDEIPGFRTKT